MIPVKLAPEPAHFDQTVRQPGLSAIDEMVGRDPRVPHPGPRRKKICAHEADIPANAFPPYWREVLPDLLKAYEQRCAYLAMHIHLATGAPTVDHRVPKSSAWHQVYEWNNYRLCAGVINSKKGASLSLVDPCEILPDWFALNLQTFHVVPGACAPPSDIDRIKATLPVLNLRPCVKEREEYISLYRLGPGNGGIDLAYLENRAPFLALELRRQNQLAPRDNAASL